MKIENCKAGMRVLVDCRQCRCNSGAKCCQPLPHEDRIVEIRNKKCILATSGTCYPSQFEPIEDKKVSTDWSIEALRAIKDRGGSKAMGRS